MLKVIESLMQENMAEFIAKKREIFLVQMSLDNKRAEIRKLEEGSFQREEVGFEGILNSIDEI